MTDQSDLDNNARFDNQSEILRNSSKLQTKYLDLDEIFESANSFITNAIAIGVENSNISFVIAQMTYNMISEDVVIF